MYRSQLMFLCVSLGLFLAWAPVQAQQLAFPTAEGFGRFSQGGRGGKAYNINSLSPFAGTGGSCNAGGCSGGTITFRDCLQDRFNVGARTCIFKTGGIIDWPCSYDQGYPGCDVLKSNLTIAGQTAPGDGILIKGMQLLFRDSHDIIVRHLRVRPGKGAPAPESAGAIETFSYSTLAYNVIIDHYSAGWASDDALAGSSASTTYQWGLLSEGRGTTPTDRSKCGLWGSSVYGQVEASFLHNLWVNHWYRCLSLYSGKFQLVNNVIYDIYAGTQVFPVTTSAPFTELVNNFYKPGPRSQTDIGNAIDMLGCDYDPAVHCDQADASRTYLSGNLHTLLRPNNTYPETSLLFQRGSRAMPISTVPLGGFPAIPTQTDANTAVTQNLAKAGAYAVADGVYATVRRDSIDARAITDYNNNTGTSDPPDQDEIYFSGGYPTYAAGTPYTDTDGDGMADAWETAHGLNPADPSDGPTIDAASGYSHLELFLNELAGDPAPIPTVPDITSQLELSLPLNEGSGPVSADVTGHGHTAQLMNTPAWVAGRGCPGLDKAISLNGSTQSLFVPGLLTSPPAITIALWANLTSLSLHGCDLLTLGDHVALRLNSFTSLTGFYYTGATWRELTATISSPSGAWHHFAYTAQAGTQRLYLDGVPIASSNTTDAIGYAGLGPDTWIGRQGNFATGYYCGGVVDDVRVYTRALSLSDIALLAAQ
jgi:hypothetical protein